ncbi:MAG: Gfo/Idh/MocA family oxidoreductase [Dehalococcoidales bacterium]|nr:Gfo/Idh/MocA family oxidoreductase [Dehalococcoidales bacterium]
MIKSGVVGCGYWGPKHIRVCNELPESDLTMVCDLDENRLKQVRIQYPCVSTTQDYEEFLKSDIEAVVISTPVKSHYCLAKKALENGKHVLIEKPITASSREAIELIELAEKRNLVLMAGHTYEYHPAVEFLKDLVKSGELGDIYSIDAARLNLGLYRPDVNVIWDLAPHDISIMLAVLDQDPVSVSARGTQHAERGVCDMAYLDILFANGTIGHVHVSWLHPRKIREITIVGSQKMSVYDDVSESEKIHIYDKGLTQTNGTNGFSSWPPNYRYGDVIIPYITGAEPLKQECSHFFKCIEEGKTPRSDGWAGLKVTSILEAADKSMAHEGRREKLELPSMVLS